MPTLGLPVAAFAVVGMAALFAACVRAPLTSIMIAIEMTGRANWTLALLAGSLGAMMAAILLKSEPIYESPEKAHVARRIDFVTRSQIAGGR